MKLILYLSALLLAAILLAGAGAPTNETPAYTSTNSVRYVADTNYTALPTTWGDYLPLEIQSTGQVMFSLSRPLTNHYSNLLAVLSITPLTNRCSLCGEQHHEQHVCHYEAWDTFTVEIVCQGQTSTPQVWMGPRESRIVTQTVARTHAVAPSASTLNWTNFIYKDPYLSVSNYINLQAITPR